MATQVITNAYVLVNAVDLSDHCVKAVIHNAQDMLEDTVMGATAHTMKPGLLKQSIELEFLQDRASAKVDATIAGLIGGAAVAVVVKAVNTTLGPTNPTWTISAAYVDGDYLGVNGQVGQLEKVSVKFVPGSGSALVRATA